MPLTGQAKIDYQREYMRKRRSNTQTSARSNQTVRPVTPEPVRPMSNLEVLDMKHAINRSTQRKSVRPEGISESQWNYIQYKAEQGIA